MQFAHRASSSNVATRASPQSRIAVNAFITVLTCMCLGFLYKPDEVYDARKDNSYVVANQDLIYHVDVGHKASENLNTSVMGTLLPITFISSVVVHVVFIMAILALDQALMITEISCSALFFLMFLSCGISAFNITRTRTSESYDSFKYASMTITSLATAFALFMKIVSLTYSLQRDQIYSIPLTGSDNFDVLPPRYRTPLSCAVPIEDLPPVYEDVVKVVDEPPPNYNRAMK